MATENSPNRRLRDCRRRRFLTQEELAERLGVSPLTVRRWELGQQEPQPYHLRRLCQELDCSPAEIGHGDIAMTDTKETPRLTPTSSPELDALGDMIDWLAEASGQSTAELRRRAAARMDRPPDAPPGGATNRQQVAATVIAYYGDRNLRDAGLTPYAVKLDGRRLDLAMATRPEWSRCAVRLVNPTSPADAAGERCSLVRAPHLETPFTDAGVLDRAIDRLAATAAGSRTGTAPVMVNKPLYRLIDLELGGSRMDATFGLDCFAHYALSYDLMVAELFGAVADRSDPVHLPLRDRLLPRATDMANISGRLCSGGLGCTFAIARSASWAHPADFLIVVQRRSGRVLNMSRSLSVMPRAFHQHLVDAREEVAVGVTVAREIEEELFGRADVDEGGGRAVLTLNPHHQARWSPPMRWLAERGAYHAECIGFGINLVTSEYWFTCLAYVTDEEFWTKFSGACFPNWEASDVQTYSTADREGLVELISDERWSSEDLFAFLHGLRRLAELFPDRVALPELEVVQP